MLKQQKCRFDVCLDIDMDFPFFLGMLRDYECVIFSLVKYLKKLN
jgi:hypothetical protein